MLWRESFITTGRKKSKLSVWRVVLLCQFLVLAGNRQFFVVVGKFYYDRKKKVPVICLAGCAVVSVFGSGNYNRKKKVLVICLAGCAVVSVFGSGDYDRKKKITVVCLAGCAVVSVFSSGDYGRKTKLQSSVWRVVLLCQFLVLAGNRQFFCCGGKVLLQPEKKLQSSVWRFVLLCQCFWFWREIGSFFVVAGNFITTGKKVTVVCLAGCAVVSVFGSGDYDRKKKSYSTF